MRDKEYLPWFFCIALIQDQGQRDISINAIFLYRAKLSAHLRGEKTNDGALWSDLFKVYVMLFYMMESFNENTF